MPRLMFACAVSVCTLALYTSSGAGAATFAYDQASAQNLIAKDTRHALDGFVIARRGADDPAGDDRGGTRGGGGGGTDNPPGDDRGGTRHAPAIDGLPSAATI